jgi:hypothetical protein
MFTLFKYLVWLVVALLCLMLATISISEFLVESAIDAPYDEKLTDYVRVLASAVEADGDGLRVRQAGLQVMRSDRHDRIFYSVRDPDGNVIAGETQLAAVPGALRAGMPMLQNGVVGEEPVRVAALQIVDPRKVDATLIVEVGETLNKR